VLLTAVCLPQSYTELASPAIKRVGTRLSCNCGVCSDTVAVCVMLECGYSKPARVKIAAMQKQGLDDDTIVASFVKDSGKAALSAPPGEGFNVLGYLMPFFALLLGLAGIALYIKKFRPRARLAAIPPQDAAVLARYRDRIDREMTKLE